MADRARGRPPARPHRPARRRARVRRARRPAVRRAAPRPAAGGTRAPPRARAGARALERRCRRRAAGRLRGAHRRARRGQRPRASPVSPTASKAPVCPSSTAPWSGGAAGRGAHGPARGARRCRARPRRRRADRRARRRAGLPTVLDLCRRRRRRRLRRAPAALGPGRRARAACGLVAAVPGARAHGRARVRRAGARAARRCSRARRPATLRDARVPIDPAAPRVIGWRLAEPGGEGRAVHRGRGRRHRAVPHREPRPRGDRRRRRPAPVGAARPRAGGGRAARASSTPRRSPGGPCTCGHPCCSAGDVLDDARVLEEASCAGVPSVMPADACSGVDGFVSPHVLVAAVDDAAQWYDVLHHVLDDPTVRMRRARRKRRAAPTRSTARPRPRRSCSRLMGWAAYRRAGVPA